MRIALVSPYDFATPGGVNQHIEYLRREFRRHGHEVVVIAPLSESAADVETPDFHGFGGIVPISLNGSVARISFSFDLRRRIKRLMEQEPFDVVHLQEPLIPALPLMVLQYSRSVNIGTFHAYAEGSLGYFYARPVLQRFFDKLDGTIAVSEPAREFASQYFSGEFRLIPNGVDVSSFTRPAAPVEWLMDGRPNMLFLGRFDEERKGFKYALKALRWVREMYPDVRLVVVGGGDVSKYRRQIRKYGIGQNVYFAGRVSDEERASYMASSLFLVAPSTHGESQGLVLLEAMAAGLPVIAGDIPGYASIVADGEEGFLVPRESEHSLAIAMVRLLADANARTIMGAKGRIRAAEHSWPKVASKLLEYYTEVRQRRAGLVGGAEAPVSRRVKFLRYTKLRRSPDGSHKERRGRLRVALRKVRGA